MTRILAEAFFWLAIVAVGFWIYQSILLPTVRQETRYKLFVLRDRLRRLAIEGRVKPTSAPFKRVQSHLNKMIDSISYLDVKLIQTALQETSEESMDRELQEFHAQILKDEEIRAIYDEGLQIVAMAVLFNSLPYLIWMMILALPHASVRHIARSAAQRYEPKVEPVFAGLAGRSLIAT